MVQTFEKWIVDLNDLREQDEPLKVSATRSDQQLGLYNLCKFDGPLSTEMVVALDNVRVSVTGGLSVHLDLACCRCLTRFSRYIEKKFKVEYWPDPEVEEGEELELTYEDLDVGFYRNDEIDLNSVISEQVVLDLPMKPICREGCKGLCDQCGANLNEGTCSCERSRIDPRLSVLVELKKRMNH
ncbi:MAG TPA: DUF177 domain-containing protein [Acidobacteriota bacterium]|nr:DUF177 domain-containing protein [Acidobacteriota bacterium]